MRKRGLVAKRPRKLASYEVAGNAAQVKFVLKEGVTILRATRSLTTNWVQKLAFYLMKASGVSFLRIFPNKSWDHVKVMERFKNSKRSF